MDVECYFDKDYTLKKMTTEAYVRDPRFEFHGVGVQWLDEKQGRFYTQGELHELQKLDWSQIGILAHHAQFDGLCFSHHLGIRPGMWLDTLSMARMVHGNHVRAGLESLARLYNLGSKTVPYDRMRGVRWANMPSDLRRELADGCLQDVQLTRWLFSRLLLEGFPDEELRVVDQTIRIFTEPRLIGDLNIFYQVQQEEWHKKNEMLMELGASETSISSTPQFCALLEKEGVEIEYKATKTGEAPAVAKTDQFLQDLLEDPNPRVAALAAARLEIKSTIKETRAGRLAAMASRGPLCVYLAANGAHTLRWAGGDKINFQNFPRQGLLRQGIQAPPGYKLVIVDLSQIECRIVNWIAGNRDLVFKLHERGSFVYCEGATEIYERPITKADLEEYTVGKKRELGCGYGMGAARFKAMVYGDTKLVLSHEFCERAINLYRLSHKPVKDFWYLCDTFLRMMYWGQPFDILDGLLHYDHTRQRLYGPNGTWMTYELEWKQDSFRRKTRSGWRRIWGGGLTENIVQYLARIVMSQAALRIEDKFGLRMVLTAHDEGVWIVPEQDAERLVPLLEKEMAATPTWLPGIPLGAEGKIGDNYGK